jgi:pimeloyl-ACP methyl ester carboxylesterase
MAAFDRGATTIHYDLEGPDDGFPVLLIAPGGMRSANEIWYDMPWNPRAALGDSYRLIGMDQRNAGRSTAPVSAADDWATMRDDQLALLDHLGVERCHVVGMCIGGPYIAGLLQAAPDRVASAVMLQPVGIEPDGSNRQAFYEMFDAWAETKTESHPEVDPASWEAFRSNLWDGDFLLTASRDDLAGFEVPLLVAMGNDMYHPESTSRDVAAHGRNVTFVERWKDGDALAEFDMIAQRFLAANSSR